MWTQNVPSHTFIPSYSWILHMCLHDCECPAGGRPPDMQNTILWRLLSVCVALTEGTDKTPHTNWVLQQPQYHNALSLPRGQCVWLFLCSDIQGVCSISVCACVWVSVCMCVCLLHRYVCQPPPQIWGCSVCVQSGTPAEARKTAQVVSAATVNVHLDCSCSS